MPGEQEKLGRGGKGVRNERNRLRRISGILPTPFVHEREAMEHFDWLRVRLSNVMTKFLLEWICVYHKHPVHKVEKKSFEFSIQETLDVLAQNGNCIHLRPEQKAAIEIPVRGQDVQYQLILVEA